VLAAAGGQTTSPTHPSGYSYISTPSGRIAFSEWGERNAARGTLLLLHGFSGDRQTWSGFATAMARSGFHLVAPDLPAHGLTEIDAEGVEDLVAPLKHFIEFLGPGPIEVIGHSLGAYAAVRLVLSGQPSIRRLTLLSPAGLGPEIDGEFVMGVAAMRNAGALAHWLRRLSVRPPTLSDATLAEMATELSKGRLARLSQSLVQSGQQQIDIVSGLDRLQVPIRVVFGLQDRIIPWQQVANLPAKVAVHLINQAGHMPHWDQLSAVTQLFD
jgi:pyruvate dehydrogenase E2 component (dihydrolipoamide acetyltransferase)